jgi:hypothetical protein
MLRGSRRVWIFDRKFGADLLVGVPRAQSADIQANLEVVRGARPHGDHLHIVRETAYS